MGGRHPRQGVEIRKVNEAVFNPLQLNRDLKDLLYQVVR
jgi:hypothetical protein